MELYSHLFSRAYADLLGKQAEKNYLTPAELEVGRFVSLDNYFAHMGDLFEINPKYLMLPLDETSEALFKIDANTRKVTIPKPFDTCSGVQTDNMCEIVVFTIDRYFDYQDLADLNICVQWIRPGGTPDDEGISHITMIDLETYPGQLRFGWALTNEITKYPGKVKFAVRFYRKKDNKYQYVLNTEEAQLTIKAGLDIVNPAIEENATDLFGDFVKNSMNPSFELPEQAFFTKPGIDLPSTAAIDYATDTLVLKAQAVANDLGYISYVWKYKSDIEGSEKVTLENDDAYTIASDVPVLVTDIVRETIANTGDVSKFVPLLDAAGEEVKDEDDNIIYTIGKREGGQKYFVPYPKADGETGYQLYLDKIDEQNPAPADLVELMTTLTLNPVADGGSEFITGEYQVEATNTIYLDHSDPEGFRNTTPVAFSNKCVIPGPNVVELNKKFTKHAFIKDAAGVELKIEVKEDKTNPDYFYTWYNYPRAEGNKTVPTKVEEDMTVIENLGTDNYAVTTPGWYAAKVDAVLNRKTMTAITDICRITGYPAKPNILKLEYAPIGFDDNGVELTDDEMAWTELKSDNDANATEVEKNMSTGWKNGDLIRLRVITDVDDKVDFLNSDKLLYSWYVQLPDEGKRLITSADIGYNSIIREGTQIDGKTLDVRCLLNTTEESQAAVYSCVITNQLGEGDKSHSDPCDTSKYNTFVVM